MNKKSLTGLLCLLLMLGLLAACSGGGESAGNGNTGGDTSGENASGGDREPATAGEAEGEAGGDAEEVTIRLHTHGNEANYNWKQTIAAFEEKYPEINVEVVILSEKGDSHEALQKLDLAAASNEQLDVLMFSDPASYAQRVGLGMVAPMDAFIEQEGFEVTEEYKVDTKMNGKYYALPGKFNPWYVLLNKDHLEEAGLPVPEDWTWDEFMEYARELTQGEGPSKRYGTYFHGPQNGGWMEFMKLTLGNQTDNSGFIKADGTSNLDDPDFRKTLEIRWKMEKEDQSATPYSDIISQKLHYRAQFFNQSASMILIGSWMNTELGGTEQFPLDFEVAVAPYPKNNPSDPTGYTPVTTDYMAIAEKSKHKEEAYKFIRWYTTEGQIAQGKNIPSWNNVGDDDLAGIIDTILSGTQTPEKVDKESLIRVMKNSKSSKIIPPVTYQAEVYQIVQEEYELMILESQSLDEALANMQERVQDLIENNQ